MVYRFAVIIQSTSELTTEMQNALHLAGCADLTPISRGDTFRVRFERSRDDLSAAVGPVVDQIKRVGLRVARIEIEQGSLPRYP